MAELIRHKDKHGNVVEIYSKKDKGSNTTKIYLATTNKGKHVLVTVPLAVLNIAVEKANDINYKELLLKYMSHVLDLEGVAFLERSEYLDANDVNELEKLLAHINK